MTLYKIQRKYQRMSLFLISWILKIAELNAEKLFLKIRECSWNSRLGLS